MRNFVIAALALLSLVIGDAKAGTTIHFVPGPSGGSKIITPWGNFVAIPSGNSVWIGTVEEYMDRKVDAIARQNGEKKISVDGEQFYVSTKGLSTTVGNNTLYDITTDILFGMPADRKLRRPPKPKNAEYVSIVWIPSTERKIVTALLASIDGKTTYQASDCQVEDQFGYCEFIVPRTALTIPMMYVFTMRGAKPSAVQIESIAREHAQGIQRNYQSTLRGIEPSQDDLDDLRNLHVLDESIPLSPL